MTIINLNAAKVDINDLFNSLICNISKIILSVFAMSTLIGLISLYLIPPLYTSTSSIYIMNRLDETRTTYSDLQSGTQLTQDYMALITSRNVMEQVVQSTGMDISADELESMITIANPDDTRILEISITDFDPATAKVLVDTVVKVSSEILVKAMDIYKVNIIDHGNLPIKPTGKNQARSFLSGGILGFILSSTVIIIRHKLNDNIKSSDDIERLLGITTLGAIPSSDDAYIDKHVNKRRNKKVAFIN